MQKVFANFLSCFIRWHEPWCNEGGWPGSAGGSVMQWGGLNSHRALRCIGITTWGYVDNNENLTSGTEGRWVGVMTRCSVWSVGSVDNCLCI